MNRYFSLSTNPLTNQRCMLGTTRIGSPPMNLVPTRVSAGLTMVFEGGLRLPLPDRAGMQVRPDMDVIMGLRTEDITVVNGHEQFPSEWKAEGIVEVVEPLGSETNLHLDLSLSLIHI